MLVVVVRYETAATARWALLFIVRAFFNDTIAVAVWTGFHVRLMLPQPRDYIRWCLADPTIAARPLSAKSGHCKPKGQKRTSGISFNHLSGASGNKSVNPI